MVLIIGRGESGTAAARLLDKLGQKYIITDADAALDLTGVEYAVISPGVYPDSPLARRLAESKIRVISEVELAASHCGGARIIAVTGTNGKTTVATLLHQILKQDGFAPHLLGNVGVAFCNEALGLNALDTVVLEVSSFQLCAIESFHPHIACILNITPDHLDYHGGMDEYAAAKLRITVNQNENDHLILSADNIPVEYLRRIETRAKIHYISMRNKVGGAYLFDGEIYYGDEHIASKTAIPLLGAHNISNVLFCVCAAKLYGVSTESLKTAISEFRPPAHRLEFVRDFCGIRFYNDSKATNIDAALAAAVAFDSPTVLLAGGSDKGYEFDALFKSLPPHIIAVVTFGATAPKICEAAARSGYQNIFRVNTLSEAVEAARGIDCANILLSPACASFDQYQNYKERGCAFAAVVNGLK